MTVLNRRVLEMSNITNHRAQDELKALLKFKDQKNTFCLCHFTTSPITGSTMFSLRFKTTDDCLSI